MLEFLTSENVKNIMELGGTLIISLVSLSFGYQLFLRWSEENKEEAKQRKNNTPAVNLEILLGEVKLMNSNHLNAIEKAIRDGSDRQCDAINEGNMKIVELLGEIKGKLK